MIKRKEREVEVGDRVALVGTCPSSRMLAPYDDKSWKIWSCSPANAPGAPENVDGGIPRVDCWFELHGDLLWPENNSLGFKEYVEWLNRQTGFVIYAQDQSIIKNSVTFPAKTLVKKFGRLFFTSTFSWMLAYAMHKGVREVGVYGIDMSVTSEYAYQRPQFQALMWIAMKSGMSIIVPPESDIAQPPPLYGYEDATERGRKLFVRKRELESRISAMESQIKQLERNKTFLDGAAENITYMMQTWVNASPALSDDEFDSIITKSDELLMEAEAILKAAE